jgi:hypothetical protein
VPEPRPGAVEAAVARMLAEAEAITGEAALTGGPDEENPGLVFSGRGSNLTMAEGEEFEPSSRLDRLTIFKISRIHRE